MASDETEDDVLAIVTPVEGKTIDAAELVAFLAERVPHFMVPRYNPRDTGSAQDRQWQAAENTRCAMTA